MQLNEIIQMDKKYYMNTFGDRIPVCFERGRGMKLYDTQGKEYYDFFAGIAVSVLGHSHPTLVSAIQKQAEQLLHTSCLYYIKPQAELAGEIVRHSCADKVFFSNSGAEANEGAIKLARMYHYKKGNGRYEIITLKNSFHGRTLTTVAATGQVKYQKPYAPLTPGFVHVDINNIDAFEKAVTKKTAAVILEPVQGEGGVFPVCNEYLSPLEDICRKNDILIIFDEIQTGMGRTGKLWGYEHTPVKPDIFTIAKALGGGIPISALAAHGNVAESFEPGDHGGTYGGNPLSCAAGLAVFKTMDSEDLVKNAEVMGDYFREKLLKIPKILQVRGRGLMIGAAVKGGAGEIVREMFNRGFLVGPVGDKTLRILPPLIVTKEDIDKFTSVLADVLDGRINK